jgi:hypothetical protein
MYASKHNHYVGGRVYRVNDIRLEKGQKLGKEEEKRASNLEILRQSLEATHIGARNKRAKKKYIHFA